MLKMILSLLALTSLMACSKSTSGPENHPVPSGNPGQTGEAGLGGPFHATVQNSTYLEEITTTDHNQLPQAVVINHQIVGSQQGADAMARSSMVMCYAINESGQFFQTGEVLNMAAPQAGTNHSIHLIVSQGVSQSNQNKSMAIACAKNNADVSAQEAADALAGIFQISN